jgi:hypothetical protein
VMAMPLRKAPSIAASLPSTNSDIGQQLLGITGHWGTFT